MKFHHMFLGEVTLADPSLEEAVADNVAPESFVTVIDSTGAQTSARVRTLEPIFEMPIPESHRSLNTLADEILEINTSKGFSSPDEEPNIDQMLMLIVGELSEAQEELRDGHAVDEVYYKQSAPDKPEGFGVEVADALIRILHLAARLDLDLDALVRLKLEFNRTRPFKHGKAF